MTYYAHSSSEHGRSEGHPLICHLESTARLAAELADPFRAQRLAFASGLLHDIGKYSDEFQRRLRGDSLRVDHSTAGAIEATKIFGRAIGLILAYAIAGHHAGLPDYGSVADGDSLCRRLLGMSLPNYDAFRDEVLEHLPDKAELALPISPVDDHPGFSFQFFVRFLFSCLVDADFLDTEAFMNPGRASVRSGYPPLRELAERLDSYLATLQGKSRDSAINDLRRDILDSCKTNAECAPGMFSLTVPTGGGKTLSSLAFALRHAIRHKMQRVIYVIPFTSIIEQNADVFRQAVGSDSVLEHHSNFQFPDEGQETLTPEQYRLLTSSENWDAPIIVTTNVQFYESLFAAKASRCRKLHNIANSVIILDEAQTLPVNFLRICLYSLVELVRNYGASVMLCTATQPSIQSLLPLDLQVCELAPEPKRLYEALRRVTVADLGDLDNQGLVERLRGHDQVLCIVNTRKHAIQLAELMREEGAYHLSARMCPKHRSQVLSRIRQALEDGVVCRVISTQLIEAGVDIDFPVVYRAITGIDSIAQAAGRCNREGEIDVGLTYLFRPDSDGLPIGWFTRTASVTDMVLRQHSDPLTLDAVTLYFDMLYDVEREKLDSEAILASIDEGAKHLAFGFREMASKVRLISDAGSPIVIPFDEDCVSVLDRTRYAGPSTRLSRLLQQYTVQVYENELRHLFECGAVEVVGGQYTVLRDLALYDQELGLSYPDDRAYTSTLMV